MKLTSGQLLDEKKALPKIIKWCTVKVSGLITSCLISKRYNSHRWKAQSTLCPAENRNVRNFLTKYKIIINPHSSSCNLWKYLSTTISTSLPSCDRSKTEAVSKAKKTQRETKKQGVKKIHRWVQAVAFSCCWIGLNCPVFHRLASYNAPEAYPLFIAGLS